MAGQDWFEKDFYSTLGVPKDADQAAIKQSYRKLARVFHPDANAGDASAEERFKEVSEAYSVLSDPEQRQQYDSVRAMAGGGARFAAGPGGAGGAGGFEDMLSGMFGGGGRVRFANGGSGGINLEDLLGGYGGAGPFGGPPPRGQDIAAAVTLPFRQAVQGSTQSLSLDGKPITVRIPAGVTNGQKIKLAGKGRPSPYGGQPGDLIITVNVPPHPVYRLDGNNLRMTVPVSIDEAALGARIEVPGLDGTKVRLKVPAGTPSGRTLRLKAKGITTAKGTGDLLVSIQIAVPQNLSGAGKKAMEDLRDAMKGHDPRADLMTQAGS
ncbi:MAG: DnaJ domain-containing protein [Micrococcales bacterium]|nr:DnaJ domain-containing protein [Micrococcales bacterium]